MTQANFGCELEFNNEAGGTATLCIVDVENEFVGISITERNGLNMRRVGVEAKDMEAIRLMRDTLSAFIDRHSN